MPRCTNTYLGRFQLGQKVPLPLQCVDADGAAAAPDAPPYADIYRGTTLVETVRLTQMGDITGLFGKRHLLGLRYATGSHVAVLRYALSSVKYTQAAHFEVLAGGATVGPAVALREYAKPEARYIVQLKETGRLQFGRNPRL